MDARKVLTFILFHEIANVVIFAVEKDSTSSRSVYFTMRENRRLKGHDGCETVWVSKYVVVRQLVFEEQLVYFHKFQDCIQEWQRGVWA